MSDIEQNTQESVVNTKQSGNYMHLNCINIGDPYLAEWLADHGLLMYFVMISFNVVGIMTRLRQITCHSIF